nr:hypothetical protein [Geomonas sp. Red32]
MSPAKFYTLNQRIKKSIIGSKIIPESVWAGNPDLIPSYLATSDQHDLTYHGALDGSRLLISQREVLQAKTVEYLDEMASTLEAAAVRNPDVLLASGFDLGKERKSRSRKGSPPETSGT